MVFVSIVAYALQETAKPIDNAQNCLFNVDKRAILPDICLYVL